MRLYLPQSAVSPLVMIRRERLLPAPGEMLVREGERLDPVRVIGRCRIPGEFHAVNVALLLEVSPRSVRRYLKVRVGQEVKRGQVLASRGGLPRRSCRAPVDGVVRGLAAGRLVLQAPDQSVEVRAGYYGTVARVLANRGVLIQVSGAFIQGAWGNGQEGFGILHRMTESRDEGLTGEAIDASSRGVILVAGFLADPEALQRAAALQIRGMVVGSLAPELLTHAQSAPFPVVTTEGLGRIPMSVRVFHLLSTHNGREAVLDGRFESQREVRRPEIIIPLPAEPGTDRLQFRDVPLKPGDWVRAVRAPHGAMVGTVTDVPARSVRFATGARLPAVRIQPREGDSEPLWIPAANLELLL